MTMLVIAHITIALLGLMATTAAYIKPSKNRLVTSYSLIGATLASGTYLVVSTHSSLASACLSGLIYLATNLFGITLAHRKLVAQTQDVTNR